MRLFCSQKHLKVSKSSIKVIIPLRTSYLISCCSKDTLNLSSSNLPAETQQTENINFTRHNRRATGSLDINSQKSMSNMYVQYVKV